MTAHADAARELCSCLWGHDGDHDFCVNPDPFCAVHGLRRDDEAEALLAAADEQDRRAGLAE